VHPKYLLTFNGIGGFISHEAEFFVTAAIRTSDPKLILYGIITVIYISDAGTWDEILESQDSYMMLLKIKYIRRMRKLLYYYGVRIFDIIHKTLTSNNGIDFSSTPFSFTLILLVLNTHCGREIFTKYISASIQNTVTISCTHSIPHAIKNKKIDGGVMYFRDTKNYILLLNATCAANGCVCIMTPNKFNLTCPIIHCLAV
jgi:hypothetical protein